MSRPKAIDIARSVLDHQLLDVDGFRCGKVDDLEVEATPGEAARVTAILAGPRYWPARLGGPVGRVLARLGGGDGTKVPWEDVETVTAAVQLRSRAGDLGLSGAEDRFRPLFRRRSRSERR